MLYKILRQIVASLFKIYFRKIYLIDSSKVPLKGPVLISSNHPMAFAEACLLACFIDRPLYFLVRGDVFKKGWNWFFNGTNQIPIYRFRDGFSNMRRNRDSFSRAHDALADDKAILIFSEGNTRLQKKLSPLQKGLARLAFGAYAEKNVQHIQVVPVGINYSDGKSFRSDVAIKIGDPISLDQYVDLFERDQVEAVKNITDDLYSEMLPLIIHLEDSGDELLADRLFAIYGNRRGAPSWPIIDPSADRFIREKQIADQLNHLSSAQKQQLLQWTDAPDFKSAMVNWKNYLILLLGFPIALSGLILNALPFYLSKYIADKKVRQVEFYTPVRMGLNLIFYIIWLVLNLVLLALFFGWYSLLAIWIYPLSGFITILWKEGFVQATQRKMIEPSIFRKIDAMLFS